MKHNRFPPQFHILRPLVVAVGILFAVADLIPARVMVKVRVSLRASVRARTRASVRESVRGATPVTKGCLSGRRSAAALIALMIESTCKGRVRVYVRMLVFMRPVHSSIRCCAAEVTFALVFGKPCPRVLLDQTKLPFTTTSK